MDAYMTVLRKYAEFNGRARRSEYWMFHLLNTVIMGALVLVGLATDIGMAPYALYALATLVPGIAVGVRRLHDTDKSGWWLLLAIIPFGALVLLVFFATDGTSGQNRFGSDPKGR